MIGHFKKQNKTKIFSESDLTGVTSVLTLAWPPSAWPSTITYWLWCAKISGHEKFRIGLISGTVLMPDRLVMMYWITESYSGLNKAFAFNLYGKMKNLLLYSSCTRPISRIGQMFDPSLR